MPIAVTPTGSAAAGGAGAARQVAPATVEPGAASLSLAEALQPDDARACGPCTKCCDGWLTATIFGHEVKVGSGCRYRSETGCAVYEERPQNPCREFHCAWRLRGNPFPDSFRPDRLGVIILAKPWRGRIAYYLTLAGRDVDATLLEWMRSYSTATGTPFLFKVNGRYRAHGSEAFQKDMLDRARRGAPLLPGLYPGIAGPCKLAALGDDIAAAAGTDR